MANQFTPGAATEIAHKCTVATTGNNHPLSPSETLGDYGVFSGEQISLIKTRIRTDNAIGLPHFARSIDANALKDVSVDTTIMELSNIIFDNSFSAVSDLAFATEAIPRSATAPQQPRSDALLEFTRENPGFALITTAAAGLMLGYLLGRVLR